MNRLLVALLCALLGVGLLAPAAHAAPSYSPDSEELAFLDLINGYRNDLGLGKLDLQSQLGAAAVFHSEDMADHNYFDHTLSDGTSPGQNIRNFGYTGGTWGENIAAGMEDAGGAMEAWRNSPEHDAAMRNPNFTQIGIGRAYNANSAYGWYWTADFGGGEARPAPTTAPPPAPPATTTTPPVAAPADAAPSISTEDGVAESQQEAPGAIVNGVEKTTTSVNGQEPAAGVDGSGDTIVYGDINTGGTPNVVVPASFTAGAPPPADAPADAAPVAADQAAPAPAGQDGTAADGTGTLAAPGSGCGAYASWYDAQVAYENAGATGGDPGLVNAVDPNWNGIACEEMMSTS